MLPVIYKYTLLFRDKINIIFYPESKYMSQLFRKIINHPGCISVTKYLQHIRASKFYGPMPDNIENIIISLDEMSVDNSDYNEFADAYFCYDLVNTTNYDILQHIISKINGLLEQVKEKDKIILLINNVDKYLDINNLSQLLQYLQNSKIKKILISAHSYDLLYLNGKGIYASTGDIYQFSYNEYAQFILEQSKLIYIDVLKSRDRYNEYVTRKLDTLKQCKYIYTSEIENWLRLRAEYIDTLISLNDILPKYFKVKELYLETGYDNNISVICMTANSVNDLKIQEEKFDNEYWLDRSQNDLGHVLILFYNEDN